MALTLSGRYIISATPVSRPLCQSPILTISVSEMVETDLMRQVEYDMDEQGQRYSPLVVHASYSPDYDWLQTLNAERKKEQLDPISPEIFEVIIDQLEKEWFLLVRQRKFYI